MEYTKSGVEKKFRNYYKCTRIINEEICNTEWKDDWDCTCDDRCPVCNTAISPHKSEDINN